MPHSIVLHPNTESIFTLYLECYFDLSDLCLVLLDWTYLYFHSTNTTDAVLRAQAYGRSFVHKATNRRSNLAG